MFVLSVPLCVFVDFFACMSVILAVFFCLLIGIGSGDEESAREEYEVGEYVLEDLELGSAKETG